MATVEKEKVFATPRTEPQIAHHPCSDRATLMLAASYLPLLGSGKPSSVHAICGVGLPAALHFRDTAGPGCRVCSIKLYSSTGGASATEGPGSVAPLYLQQKDQGQLCTGSLTCPAVAHSAVTHSTTFQQLTHDVVKPKKPK